MPTTSSNSVFKSRSKLSFSGKKQNSKKSQLPVPIFNNNNGAASTPICSRIQNETPGSCALLNEDPRDSIKRLKSELEMEKMKSRQIQKDKLSEIKRMKSDLDLFNKKDSASNKKNKHQHELNKLREALTEEKETELRQIIKFKDEEIKILKNNFEVEKSALLSGKGDEQLKVEFEELKCINSELKEKCKNSEEIIKSKKELLKKLKFDHEREVHRILREARREQSRSITELQNVRKSLSEPDETDQPVKNTTAIQELRGDNAPDLNTDFKKRNTDLVNMARKFEEQIRQQKTEILNLKKRRIINAAHSNLKLEEECRQLKEQFINSQDEIQTLKHEKQNLEEENQRVHELERKCRDLGTRFLESEESLRILNEERKHVNKQNEDLQKKFKAIEEERKSIHTDHSKCNLKIQQKQNKIDSLSKFERKCKEQDIKLAEKENSLSNLQEQCHFLEKENQVVKKRLSQLENDNNTLETSHSQCSQQINNKQQQIDKILKEKQEIEISLADKVTRRNRELSEAQLKCNELQAQLNQVLDRRKLLATKSLQTEKLVCCNAYAQTEDEIMANRSTDDLLDTSSVLLPKIDVDTYGKVREFRVYESLYDYEPELFSRGADRSLELALSKGQKLYVFGEVDKDGFLLGELKTGERGLVASNLVNQLDDESIGWSDTDDLTDVSTMRLDATISERLPRSLATKDLAAVPKKNLHNLSTLTTSKKNVDLPFQQLPKNDKILPVEETIFAAKEITSEAEKPEEDDNRSMKIEELEVLSHSEVLLSSDREDEPLSEEYLLRSQLLQSLSERNFTSDSDPATIAEFYHESNAHVPAPLNVHMERQLEDSLVIAWTLPPQKPENIKGFRITVNGKTKQTVLGATRTKALLTDYDKQLSRISVSTLTEEGHTSDPRLGTITFGDMKKEIFAPYNLEVSEITTNSCTITWKPSFSTFSHQVLLDDNKAKTLDPGCFECRLEQLKPDTIYEVIVKSINHTDADNRSAPLNFTTLRQQSPSNNPDPPLYVEADVTMVETGVRLSWIPVTITEGGTSNGTVVEGYNVYATQDRLVYLMARVDGSTSDSVFLPWRQFHELKDFVSDVAVQLFLQTCCAGGVESCRSKIVRVDIPTSGRNKSPLLGKDTDSKVEDFRDSIKHIDETKIDDKKSSDSKKQQNDDISPAHVSSSSLSFSSSATNSSSSNKNENKCSNENVGMLNIEQQFGRMKLSSQTDDLTERIDNKNAGVYSSKNFENENKFTPSENTYNKSDAAEIDTTEKLNDKIDGIKTNDRLDQLRHDEEDSSNLSFEEVVSEELNSSDEADEISYEEVEEDNEEFEADNEELEQEEATTYNPENDDESESESEDRIVVGTSNELFVIEEEDEENEEEMAGYESTRSSQLHKAYRTTAFREADSNDTLSLPSERELLARHGRMKESVTDYHVLSMLEKTDVDSSQMDENHNNQDSTTGITTGYYPLDDSNVSAAEDIKDLPIDEHNDDEPPVANKDFETRDENQLLPENEVFSPAMNNLLHERSSNTIEQDSLVSSPRDKMLNFEDRIVATEEKDDQFSVGSPNLRSSSARRSLVFEDDDGKDALTCSERSEPLIMKAAPMGIYSLGATADTVSDSLILPKLPSTSNDDELAGRQDTAPDSRQTADGEPDTLSEVSFSEDADDVVEKIIMKKREDDNASALTVSEYQNMSKDSVEVSLRRQEEEEKQRKKMLKETKPQQMQQNTKPVPKNDRPYRAFIALFDYDPISMSPNGEYASDELAFTTDDIINIYGDMDEDGFYFGELQGKEGLVPSNMVEEIKASDEVASAVMKVNEEKEQQIPSTEKPVIEQQSRIEQDKAEEETINMKIDTKTPKVGTPQQLIKKNSDVRSVYSVDSSASSTDHLELRVKITMYPYDPTTSSPNVDSEAELKFSANQEVFVFGDVDDCGFYTGYVNGRKGWIPSNFVRDPTPQELAQIKIPKSFDEKSSKQGSPKLKKRNSFLKKSKKILSRLKGK